MIVKIQIPIAGGNDALAYSEDRSYVGQFPVTADLKRIMGGALKKYFEADIDDGGLLHLRDEALAQDW